MLRPQEIRILILALVTAVIIAFVGFPQEIGGTKPTPVNIIYGLRLQSDMLFYATVGAITPKADGQIGIGWNNTVWIGAHVYFYQDEGLAAFSGLELHILYPEGETIEFHPSLPIGFAITKANTIITVAASLQPAPEGQPIGSVFALSFNMKL